MEFQRNPKELIRIPMGNLKNSYDSSILLVPVPFLKHVTLAQPGVNFVILNAHSLFLSLPEIGRSTLYFTYVVDKT